MRVLIVAAMVATLALAGCVGPTTAQSLQSNAENEAAKTLTDPVLVGVLGAEWTNESLISQLSQESSEAEALAEQGVDSEPGDGLANAWAYFFQSGEDGLVVVISAGGSVVDTQTFEGAGSETFGFEHAIGDVSVDSDEAAAIVNENHARFTDVAAREDAIVMMFLAQDDQWYDGPFWAFMAVTAEGDEDFVFALVDAEDGSYQDFSDWFGG